MLSLFLALSKIGNVETLHHFPAYTIILSMTNLII